MIASCKKFSNFEKALIQFRSSLRNGICVFVLTATIVLLSVPCLILVYFASLNKSRQSKYRSYITDVIMSIPPALLNFFATVLTTRSKRVEPHIPKWDIEKKEHPTVAVIIINYNGKHDTMECLKSLEAVDYPGDYWRVTVIDNASTRDGFISRFPNAEALSNAFPKIPAIDLLRSDTNLGFSGGNNAAMDYAVAQGADYVIVLNNDTVVPPNLISGFVKASEENGGEVVVGPKFTAFPMKYASEGLQDYNKPGRATWIAAAGILIPWRILNEVGGFDHRFFIIHEDRDFADRLIGAGYSFYYQPDVLIDHKGRQSTGKVSIARTYFPARNGFLLAARNQGQNRKLFISVSQALWDSTVLLFTNGDFQPLKLTLRGIWHGIIGKYDIVAGNITASSHVSIK